MERNTIANSLELFRRVRHGVVVVMAVAGVTVVGNAGAYAQEEIPPGNDYLETTAASTYVRIGGDSQIPPIPAGFFFYGSQLYEGVIELRGEPIPGYCGAANTVVERLEEAVMPGPVSVAVELKELSLVTMAPITVLDDEGGEHLYDVTVTLNPGMASMGLMTIEDTEEGGRVFSFEGQSGGIIVYARFSFFEAWPSREEPLVLDAPELLLESVNPQPWQYEEPELCCVPGQGFYPVPEVPLQTVLDGGESGEHGVISPREPDGCCLPNGDCANIDPSDCVVMGGTAMGALCYGWEEACCLQGGTGCVTSDPLCCENYWLGTAGFAAHCVGDNNGNGIDDACESPQACCLPSGHCVDVRYEECVDRGGDPQGPGTECATLPMDCSALKWAQPPAPAYPENLYYGWNEFSGCCHAAVADDWVCDTDEPVFAIHWWGSYQDWTETYPAPEPFNHFHSFIWTDVPAGVDEPFSHPGVVVHEITADLAQVAWNFVGWDYDPRTGKYEAAFRYDYFLSEAEYFHQQAGENIYWISIGGGYCGMEPGPNPWGWKTRPRDPSSPAPDAALLMPNPGHIYTPPGTTWEEIGGGAPIYWPDPEDSWDMAFELSSRWAQATPKWEQLPDPEWPGLPAHDSDVQGTKLADQWLCQGEDVDALYWYGNYELDAAGGEIRGSGINHFHLSIHNNLPGDPWCLPQDPEIWGADVPFYAILEQDTGMVNSEGSPIYRYRYVLPWPFEQTEDEIYWFDITAISNSPGDPAHWRWQEAGRDPAPILCPAARQYYPGPSSWESIIWPDADPTLYTDLAFEVAWIFYGEADVKWSQPPEPYVPADAYNGWNELSVYGEVGDTQIVADDWYCDTELPVTDLHWWGSFIGWSEPYPPPDLPADLAFHIAIWTDVPVGEDDPFSHPGVVLWEALCEEVSIDFAGWDFDPRDPAAPPEACFKFRCYFAEEDWFYQDVGDNIYWVSISAVYPAGAVPEYPWGWKARPRHADSPAPDDAVRIFDPTAPTADPPSVFISGEPIQWPAGDSWDMAFVLTTTLPPEAKWSQLPHGPEEGFDAASDLWWSGPAPDEQREALAASAEEVLPRVFSGPQMTNMGEELVPVFTGHVLGGGDGRGTGILYAPAQPDNPGFRAAVSGITGEPCDYFDVRFATPTVAQMLNYSCVFTWINYACADPVQFGDNLAAYVDAGGSVILGYWCYDIGQGNFLAGQIMTPAYCPITAVAGCGSPYAGDGVTCIHEGVTAYSGGHEHCTTVAGALSDGTFTCGWLSVGYRPDFRVFYSAGNTGWDWGTGDWDLLVANMCACEQEPNKVVADDFVSDGRPIEALIWWGSYLDEQYAPEQDPVEPYILDGWLISFHHTEPDAVCPPDALSGDDPTVLGVYFAPAGAVEIAGSFMADCFGHGVYIYNVDLDRCCLLCSEPDPRPVAVPPDPARPGGFLETAGLRYWLDIQAVVGVQWLPESDPECEMVFTGHLPSPDTPDGHFWGWHTSPGPADPYEPMEEACTGRIVDFTPYPPDCPDYGDWETQPWLCPDDPPLPVHMAFELLTTAPRIVSVSSYHLHGTFECPLDLTTNNIEPRGVGIQTLDVTFSGGLTSVGASVQCWDTAYTGSITIDPPAGGSLVTLHFDPQLPDETCCRITFSGDASGSVEVRSLAGDLNTSNLVEIGDRDAVKNAIGQAIDLSNFTKDQNANGIIEVGDMDSILNKIGHTAPPCP